MTLNHRIRKAARGSSSYRLTFLIEQAISRYGRRFTTWDAKQKARRIYARLLRHAVWEYRQSSETGGANVLLSWASHVVRHKEKNNPAYIRAHADCKRRQELNKPFDTLVDAAVAGL